MLDPIYEQWPVMKLLWLTQEIIKFQQIPICLQGTKL